MKFRTEIQVSLSDLSISHKSRILMFGSCFAEHMSQRLINDKFTVNLNPFGVLYNPSSIKQALNFIINKNKFTEEDLILHNGVYHSLFHHGDFSDIQKEQCLENINKRLEQASEDINKIDILIITFGTSYVYELNKTGQIVGNCHKLPAKEFTRYRLSIQTIVSEWQNLLNQLKLINPTLKVIFTISPIRHLRDGAHDNQLSKSTLLLAVNEIVEKNTNAEYFPSYEIVLDDLRDYRFYEEDMTHPNDIAVQYIWEKFGDAYFNGETKSIIKEWKKLDLAIKHRPINKNTEEHKHFLKQTMLRIKQFENKYPYICVKQELNSISAQIL